MQNFGLLSDDTLVAESPQVINDSLKTIASNFSGGAFPTTNLFPFMLCYRTDLQKAYRLQGDLVTWLPEVPDSVEHAQEADHADEADHASTADSATNATNATNAQNATNAENAEVAEGLTDAVISALMLKMYPVGAIYASTVSTNPGTLFGGTWEALPAGRVLLAQGTSSWGTTYAAGSQGGEATHTLTIGEMPSHSHTASSNSTGAHTHTIYRSGNGGGSWTGIAGSPSNEYAGNYATSSSGGHSHTITISSVGSGAAHNNLPPYLAVFLFKRTA